MASITQDRRPMAITTPLGKDVLLITAFQGTEEMSQPFQFSIKVKALRSTNVPFESLIGKSITVKLDLPKNQNRFFNGVCLKMNQFDSDAEFSNYWMEIVPTVWMLSKKKQSKIFQHITIPDVLKKVFAGFDVEYQISGKFEPRDYCVQYRESDFNFASRLMEEEGIYYYFKHADGKHTMVLANTPQSHASVPVNSNITYKTTNLEATADQDYISDMSKSQQQASGKFLLWDHTFELAHQNLESEKTITDTVNIGKVAHKINAGDASKWEVYDFPGQYAQRFDGIDKGGGERPPELSKISPDGKRTVDLRMQREAAASVKVIGAGHARQMMAGHKFSVNTLASDFPTTPIKIEGEYVLTKVMHDISLPATYRSGAIGGDNQAGFSYKNKFEAMPSGIPFRPEQKAEKPSVAGMQSAQVVGPPGEEIFTDKYGRVKVQFHWDRDGKKDADSSCWIRVAHLAAGRQWGMFSLPRVGQEVLVDFLEGDPDQPIVIGCVYNPDQMPMYKLPDHKTRTYIRTNSSPGGVGYNSIRFEDKAGQEQVYIHAQKDMDIRVRNDYKERIGVDKHTRIGFHLPNDHKGDAGGETKKGNNFEEIAINDHRIVHKDFDEHIGGDYKLLVGGIDGPGKVDIHIKDTKQELIDNTSDLIVKKAVTEAFEDTYDLVVTGNATRSFSADVNETIAGDALQSVSGNVDNTVGGNQALTVSGNVGQTIGGNSSDSVGGNLSYSISANTDISSGANTSVSTGANLTLSAGGNLVLEAMNITLKGAGGFISITPAGVAIQGTLVLINSGGAAIPGQKASPKSPKSAKSAKSASKAKTAKDAKPTKAKDSDISSTGTKSN